MRRKRRVDEVVELVSQIMPGGSVLDVGCGDGELVHLLKERGYDVRGLDIDPSGCRYPEVAVQRCDIMDGLPFEDAAFDLLTVQEVIEHLEDPFKAVREFHRVLKPGGLLLLTTPNYGNIEKRLFYLHTGSLPRALEYRPSPAAAGRAHDHITPMVLPHLKYLLETNGFEVERIATANAKTKIWLLLPLVAFIWLIVHVLWSRARRRRYHISEQMKVILGGRSLVVLSRKAHESAGPRPVVRHDVHDAD